MKKESKNIKWLIAFMIVLVIISIIITACVLWRMLSKAAVEQPTKIEEVIPERKEVVLENAYITSCQKDLLTFFYLGDTYTVKAKIKEPICGVADITIKDKKIKKIAQKKTEIEGELLCYSDADMEIEGYGTIPCNENMHVYAFHQEAIREASFSNISIGENLTYVVGNGKICAILVYDEPKSDSIRVLIKNGSDLLFDKLYLSGSMEWSIDGIEQASNSVVEMSELFDTSKNTLTEEYRKSEFDISDFTKTKKVYCDGGYIYITDCNGNRISQGYEGYMHVRMIDGKLALVNQLSIEDYVRYVLPSEMEDYFPLEAQKAQAICARTFAYAQMKNKTYALYGANVDDSTSYQVYNRFGTTSFTDQAVEATKGQVLLYQNEPICCYYFSTSPGMTENLEVWNEESPTYLTPVSTMKNENEIANYWDYIMAEPESYDCASPYYRWTAKLSTADYKEAEYGRLHSLEIAKRSKSGFVTELMLYFDNGKICMTNEHDIRQFLGQFMDDLTLNDGSKRNETRMLPSASFLIKECEGTEYVLCGGGFGHGIGMSQFAAGKMAEEGMSCEQILSYFYKDVVIGTY